MQKLLDALCYRQGRIFPRLRVTRSLWADDVGQPMVDRLTVTAIRSTYPKKKAALPVVTRRAA